MSYSDKLKHPKWQRRRLEIMKRDNFSCQLCGDKETTLNVHHKIYKRSQIWEYEDEELITYCEVCHLIVEYFKKENKQITVKRIENDIDIQQGIIRIFALINKNMKEVVCLFVLDTESNELTYTSSFGIITAKRILSFFKK